MFDYRYPLLEVVQAIEHLRESRGTTNKQICDYVRKQGKNPNDPMKVLKTIRCLNKLVEEGVLCKRGKRYLFPQKNGDDSKHKKGEEEEENADEEGDDGDDDYMDNEDLRDECDQDEDDDCEEDDDDDDDDDDEEDEDDDDDDDEDDEECDEKNALVSETMSKSEEELQENKAEKIISNQKSVMGTGGSVNSTSNKCSANNNNGINNGINGKGNGKKNESGNIAKKPSNGKSSAEMKSNGGKSKGGEAIAFCARDFIDSLYPPKSDAFIEENARIFQEAAKDNMQTTQILHIFWEAKRQVMYSAHLSELELGKIYSAGNREFRTKRSRMSNNFRSRSPIRNSARTKTSAYYNLKLDESGDMGLNAITSQMFLEAMETYMDVDVDKDGDAKGTYEEICRDPSSTVVPDPNTPGALVNVKESSCSGFEKIEKKLQDEIKMEPSFECDTQFAIKTDIDSRQSIKAKENQSRRFPKDGGDKNKDKHKRSLSGDDGDEKEGERLSLCSVCEKKKRNS